MLLGFQTLTTVVLLSSRSAGTTGPLPVAWFRSNRLPAGPGAGMVIPPPVLLSTTLRDRKSTRLNSSHDQISYAVFCLKKKKNSDYVVSGDCDLLRRLNDDSC